MAVKAVRAVRAVRAAMVAFWSAAKVLLVPVGEQLRTERRAGTGARAAWGPAAASPSMAALWTWKTAR
jgi:hypothetical protein